MSSEQIQLFITSPLRYILKTRKKEHRKIEKNAELSFSYTRKQHKFRIYLCGKR